MAIICSEDSHYSMDKAANLLSLPVHKVQIDQHTRTISKGTVEQTINDAKKIGITHFIVIANVMTTMYGSVDDVTLYTEAMENHDLSFKLNIDGAYGGFYFPFSTPENDLNFSNKHVSSVTLDAHKMAQAPYGTGVFIARKGLIAYSTTAAGYVEGDDYTLIGSRSGANAVAVWMILMTNRPYGWFEKIYVLQKRTEWMCEQLNELCIGFYRNSGSNIITMETENISPDIAQKFGLVPDNHSNPNWYKIVIMEHVTLEKLMLVLNELSLELA